MYDALTIDTSTLRAAGYRFDTGILDALKQFGKGPTKLLLSEVVIREMLRHLVSDEQDHKRALEQLSKRLSGSKFHLEKKRLIDQQLENFETHVNADERLRIFLQETGAINLLSQSASTEQITTAYFQNHPPFEATGKKKEEFPDAIALFGLQNYADENDLKILAVSKDKGWKNFADQSNRIDCHDDLSEALRLVQENIEEAETLAKAYCDFLRSSHGETELDTLREFVEWEVESMDVVPECHSSFHCEEDYVEISDIRIELPDAIIENSIYAVRVGSSEITFRMDIEIIADLSAHFSLSIWDSIDKEYVGIGSSSANLIDHEFRAGFLVTLSGDPHGQPHDLQITSATIIDYPDWLDFGEVDLDYGEEEYSHFDHPELELFPVKDAQANAGVEGEKPAKSDEIAPSKSSASSDPNKST